MKYSILGVCQLFIIYSMAMELPADKLVSEWRTMEIGSYSGTPLIRYYSRNKKDREQINLITYNSSQVTLDLSNKGIYNLAKLEVLINRINPFDVLGLDLADNHISSFCIEELRKVFPNLITLDLRNNEINKLNAHNLAGIPINFGLLLSNNKITTLDEDILKIFCPMISNEKILVTTSTLPLCKTYETNVNTWERYQKNCGAMDLTKNPINPETIKKIKLWLESCQKLSWHEKILKKAVSLVKEEPKKNGFEIIFDEK